MPQTSSDSHCRQCGALLDQSILGGVCSACLWGEVVNADESDLPLIPGYEILEEIGHGGMGIVYRARQTSPNREVALKIVAPYSLRAAEARQRFLTEVETMAAVEHPGVLPLFEAGEDGSGRPWLTMQLMNGGSLADHSERYHGKWRKAAELVHALCEAVAFAHERGIIHRDLKPSNILFDGNDHPYVADFGLAKWANAEGNVTQSNYLLGSPAYLAPEAAAKGSKATTTISDVYGLGAIFYELLTGTQPYSGESAAKILTQIINQEPTSIRKIASKVPRDLEVIVLKAMSRDPARRYHSASALADDVDRWLNHRPILARPVNRIERLAIWARRNPALTTVSLLLLVSLISGGVLIWRANRDLTLALDDAEARVDFMTSELPATIKPLGRLDLLDGVFENVSEHFEDNLRSGPETLARHSDFLTQWARILRPRGMNAESRELLRGGYQKSLEAVASNKLSLEIARARVSAGLLLGEALIEDGQIPEARGILEDTRKYYDSVRDRFSEDLRLKVLHAELILELVIAEIEEGTKQQALEISKVSRKHWNEVKDLLLAAPSSPQNQLSLIDAVRYPYFESLIFEMLDDPSSQMTALREFLEGAEFLRESSPENLLYRSESIGARMAMANGFLTTGLGDVGEIRELMMEADENARVIAARDPSNLLRANESVFTAIALARLAWQRDDQGDFAHWQTQAGNRVLPLYQTYTTDLSYLTNIRDAGIFAFERRVARNWSWEKDHYEGAVNVQREMARVKPSARNFLNFARLLERCAWQISQQDSTDAAIQWLADLAGSLENENDPEGHWKWAAAFCYARAEGYRPGSAHGKESRALLLEVTPTIQFLFSSDNAKPEERLRFLTSLLEAGASDAAESDDRWIDRLSDLAPELPESDQETLSKLAAKLLPAGDARFESLKSLPRK